MVHFLHTMTSSMRASSDSPLQNFSHNSKKEHLEKYLPYKGTICKMTLGFDKLLY